MKTKTIYRDRTTGRFQSRVMRADTSRVVAKRLRLVSGLLYRFEPDRRYVVEQGQPYELVQEGSVLRAVKLTPIRLRIPEATSLFK